MMTPIAPHLRRRPSRCLPPVRIAACALAALLTAGSAHANDRAELERLRATTNALIEALVGQGLLSRERADALLRQAQAAAPVAAAPGWGDARAGGTAEADAPRGNVVRIPYLSETVRTQLRDEIRADVLSQARTEGWADSRQVPDWVKALGFEGDVRLRWQTDRFAADNLPAEFYRSQTGSPAWAPDLTNTTEDRNRLMLRARFGINAKLSDDTRTAIRISTGSNTGPTSTSQTLGSHFNKYTVVLDRAWLRWEPRYDFRVIGGRMPNPFYSTDLLWPDDLNFDGIAVQGETNLGSGIYAFATAGAFPLEEMAVDRHDKWLYGLQVGADAAIGSNTQWRIGLAMYDFRNVEGVQATEPPPTGPLAGTVPYQSSQYPSSARQKGNTLLNINDPTSTASPVWGLASKFRPINLTTGLTFKHWDPVQVGLTLDWVKNGAFDIADIRKRAGLPALALAEKNTGLQIRVLVGTEKLANRGDWQAFAAFRKFERDAWLDAFTDTTWNGGGTNYKGWSLGGTYAFDRNTTLGLRWTSTRNLDDGSNALANAPFKLDTLQVDLSARF